MALYVKLMMWLLIGMLQLNLVVAQDIPVIHEQRPRILLGQERFDWLKANLYSGNTGVTYNIFKGNYNTLWITNPKLYLDGSDSTKWTWDWENDYADLQAMMTAFLLQLESDDMAGKRCEFIVSRLVEYLNQLDFDQYPVYEKETLLRRASDIGALMLDWTYDTLPVDLRQRMVRALYRVHKIFMDEYILSESGNSYVASHNIYNCIITLQNALVLHNADGLSEMELSQVQAWYEVLMNKWDQKILPVFGYYRDDDGGWNWGAAYSMFALDDQYKCFDNILFATGKNYYEELPWVKESINQYWYFFRPDGYTIHWGDGIITLLEADEVMFRHAAMFKDARSQWLVQKYTTSAYLDNTGRIFRKLMWMDFTVPDVTHPEPPLNWWADKVGLSMSRTSWDEDATMVWFYNAPAKRAAHEHRDNNTFAIYRHKPLVVDAGYYDGTGTSHFNNYYSRTIAHNTICVYDASESYYNFGSRVSNDGGQVESKSLENFNDLFDVDFQRGEWVHYAASEKYSYSVADAGLSYNPEKLDRFVRRLLYHKPDRVIVLDHVHLRNTGTRQREAKWINHFVKRPVISGEKLEIQVAGHIETYNGQDYTLTNGDGNLAIRTLLPEQSTVNLVGGEGYEFWVDGKNYPPNGEMKQDYAHPGFWRIEVEPQQVAEDLVFLHTLKIGDNSSPSVPGGLVLQSETSIGVDWENQLYLFDSKGEIERERHHVEGVSGARSISLFVCDVRPNYYYDVMVDDQWIRSEKSNPDGILEAQLSLEPGSHSIVLERASYVGLEPIDSSDSNDEVKIYPNPAKNTVTIEILDPEVQDFRLSIYDTSGHLLSARNLSRNIGVIDLKNFTQGVYLLKVEFGTTSCTKRLLVL